MGSLQPAGAKPILIANYGTGSPAEAAAWVTYANRVKRYHAQYWTIGNEVYGNGHYGSAWEADDHADQSPAAYANAVVQYADAMKSVDPSVRIGAVLTVPAQWPDGLVGTGDAATWNATVLSIAGAKIDFVDMHWYPGNANSNPADVLAAPAQLADAIYLLRQQISHYAGPFAANIGIAVTETEAVDNDTQPGALFAADTYASLLENGAFTVAWWDLHNGPTTVTTVAGQTDFGDGGVRSSGSCIAGGCEPPINTPFPPYYAIALLNRFAGPGDQFVGASADQSLVAAHAVRRAATPRFCSSTRTRSTPIAPTSVISAIPATPDRPRRTRQCLR